MKHLNHVIGMAALGLSTRSQHPHWSDCNPIKRQSLDAEQTKEEWQRYNASMKGQRKREAIRIRKGGKLLPCISK